jgi:hypothetical protein
MAALSLCLIGCQQSPPPPATPVAAPRGTRTVELKREGDELAAKGDFGRAVVKYQAAVNQEPGDVSLRYALGVVLSHLERREETIEQFRWVLAHARPGSVELGGARSWLVSAGELNDPSLAAAAPAVPAVPASGSPSQGDAGETAGPKGKLRGTLDWGGLDPYERLIHAEARLVGEDVVTRDVKLQRRFRIGQAYEFRSLPPGRYRLTVTALDTELWDTTVTIETDRETTLDLTQKNSPVSPKDFPPKVES